MGHGHPEPERPTTAQTPSAVFMEEGTTGLHKAQNPAKHWSTCASAVEYHLTVVGLPFDSVGLAPNSVCMTPTARQSTASGF